MSLNTVEHKYKTTKSRAISFVKFEENASSADKLATEINLQNLIEDREEYEKCQKITDFRKIIF